MTTTKVRKRKKLLTYVMQISAALNRLDVRMGMVGRYNKSETAAFGGQMKSRACCSELEVSEGGFGMREVPAKYAMFVFPRC